jgi:integrase
MQYRLGRLNGRFVVSWYGTDGKRRRHRLAGATREEAASEAIDLIRRETAGPGERLTVASLWAKYRAEKDGRRVAVAMFHEWKAMGPHFGHLRPDQVSTDECRAYIERRRGQGKHDGTIWTELGHLRSVFNWAAKHSLIARSVPVERPPKPAPKDRYLTLPEIDRLLAADGAHHIKLAIHLMLSTAARVTAVLELTWDRVDFDGGKINLRTDALGPRKGRAVVPMNAGLRAALSHARQLALTDYVVEWNGEPVRSIKTGFNAVVKAAGLVGVTPHVLRHSAAVHMVEAGIPFDQVAQFLGHSNPQVTFRVYGRFSPSHLRKAANVLDFTTIKARNG